MAASAPWLSSARQSPRCNSVSADPAAALKPACRSVSVKTGPRNERRNAAFRLLCLNVASDVSGEHASDSSKRQSKRGTILIGSGSAVPKCVVSNNDLANFVETNDEWIATRTGIKNRRVLTGDETITDLAISASRNALEMASVDVLDIDLIILCTSTPDDIFGGACQVQAALGCKNAVAFDLTAACSGFVLGLITASRFIQGGGFKNVLVIGADALSRYVDWNDRGTCILFGDGSGAVVVRAAEDGEEDGVLGFEMCSDGIGQKHLHAVISPEENGNGSDSKLNDLFIPLKAKTNFIQMNGKEVFRFAVRAVPQVVEKALQEAGITTETVDWLLLHQANQRILDAVAEKINFPSDRVISNLSDYGNTSAASIPLALDESVRSGKIKDGNILAIAGFGAGLSWASAIVRWR